MKNKDDELAGSRGERLQTLLHEARPAPALPPRFHEQVWERIERAELPREAPGGFWLDALMRRLLRPQILVAGATALALVSGVAGALGGSLAAKEVAKARYIESVAPNTLR